MHKHRCAICIQHCYRLLCKTPATQTNTHNSATSFCQWKTEIKKKPKRRRRENKTKTTTKSIHTRKIERYWDFVSHFWRGWSSGVKLCTLFESRKFPSSAHLLCIRHCFSFRCIYETGKGSCGKIGCVELSQRRAKGDTNKNTATTQSRWREEKKSPTRMSKSWLCCFHFFSTLWLVSSFALFFLRHICVQNNCQPIRMMAFGFINPLLIPILKVTNDR